MRTSNPSSFHFLQPSRRTVHGLVVGILLVLGYRGTMEVRLRHPPAQIAALEQIG